MTRKHLSGKNRSRLTRNASGEPTQQAVIRYQLRYPPQVPFAATRPGAVMRVLEPIDG